MFVKTKLPYGSVFVDASWRDLLAAYTSLLTTSKREHLYSEIEDAFSKHKSSETDSNISSTSKKRSGIMVTYCVRSAFDIWLKVMNFPKGSRIMLSAITIPDIPAIIEDHGLIPVPIDINEDTLSPTVDQLDRVYRKNTVAILIAHIWGKRVATDHIVEYAKRKNLFFIEDCAEAYTGPGEWMGSPEADISLFSFGSIKTGTAFGGGISVVKCRETLEQMKSIQQRYTSQTRLQYFKKIFKYTFVMIFFYPSMTACLFNTVLTLRVDIQKVFNYFVSLLRGFKKQSMLRGIRHSPSLPLLKVLLRRLKQFDKSDFLKGTRNGEIMQRLLPKSLRIPGTNVVEKNFWLYPVIVPTKPDYVINELSKRKLDIYNGITQLEYIRPSALDKKSVPVPENAKRLVEHLVYLPVDKRVPLETLECISTNLEESILSLKHKSKL